MFDVELEQPSRWSDTLAGTSAARLLNDSMTIDKFISNLQINALTAQAYLKLGSACPKSITFVVLFKEGRTVEHFAWVEAQL
jgi:hypothetical protein